MTQRVVNYKYGTGNPVLPDGSIDVRDGIDNLQSLDVFMNAPEDTYNQRDGEIVRTVAGMNNEFDAQILNMGFTLVGTFAAGETLTNPRQTLLWDIADGGDGQEYGWSGAFPKVVPVASTPASTGGISVGAWISRFDPELRIQAREALRRSYAEAGYNLVAGSFEAGGTLVNVNDVLLQESTGKAFSGPAGTVAAGTDPTSGGFVDVSGELLADFDYGKDYLAGTIRSLLKKTLVVTEAPFYVDNTYATPAHVKLQEAINFAVANNIGRVRIPAGRYNMSQGGFYLPEFGGVVIECDGYRTVFDASEATTAFDTLGTTNSAAATETNRFSGGLFIGNPTTGAYSVSSEYVTNGSVIENFMVTGGANGVRYQKQWYSSVRNARIRNCTDIGLHIKHTSGLDTNNAINFDGIYIGGCGVNYKLEGPSGASALCINFYGCTSEQSIKTSFTSNNYRVINWYGGYFEANGSDSTAVPDIYLESGTMNLFGTSHQNSASTRAGAIIGGNVSNKPKIRSYGTSYVKFGAATDYVDSNVEFELFGEIEGSDKTYINAVSSSPKRVALTASEVYAKSSTKIDVNNKTVTGTSVQIPLFNVDLNGAQTNEVYVVDFQVDANAVSRWGSHKINVVVRKSGSAFNVDVSNAHLTQGASSGFGTANASISGGILSLGFLTFASALTTTVNATLYPVMCGSNTRVISITKL